MKNILFAVILLLSINAFSKKKKKEKSSEKKQTEKILLNTNHMFSSIKGIAGDSISSIKLLELPTYKTED